MSFVVTAPELVTAAATNLAGIGSALDEATAAAAGPTTGVAAAAADEVSIATARLFGTYGQEFHAATAQATAFHDEFVQLLNGGAVSYLGAEIANAEQGLLNTVHAPTHAVLDQLSSGITAAAAVPGGAYQQLFANTATNLQALYGAWTADPLPFLRQVIANQQDYWQQIATALTSTVQNFPANLANLPTVIQAGIKELLTFDAAYYVQQFITTQIGFAQTFAASMNNAVTGLVAGFPAFEAGLQTAFQAVLAGNYNGAVTDVAQAFANLLVTGFDTSNVTGGLVGTTAVVTTVPQLLGPLGDLFTVMNIPGQEAQYLTDLMPPSTLRQVSQNFTDVLNTLTLPNISATITIPLLAPQTGSLSAFFGLPLVLTYATAGAPIAALNGVATSATAVQQALLTGNGVAALGALVDAPAVVTNGFLNSDVLVDLTMPVPVTLPPPFPSFTVEIILHLPFDGILVPPHPITATVDMSSPGVQSFPVTVFGTPFMGLAPLLINYLPQQLANAIAPAA